VQSQKIDPFIGRTAELALLRELCAKVRSGRPQTILIEGPAGIGKTSLVEQFVQAEDDVQILRASGERWEALIAFGVVDQMMRAAGTGRASLFARRDQALPSEEPVGVGAVLLEALDGIEQTAPVILLIDDAHWADLDSLRSLMFALRRLVTGRVMTVLTVRDEDAGRLPDGLRRLATDPSGRTIRLRALDAAEVQSLGIALGVPHFAAWTAQRLTDHTGGNPLYVRALLAELPLARWRSWEPVLPAPRAFAAQIMNRLSACGAEARALVEAASVLGVRCALSTAAELGGVDDAAGALEEAATVGLLHGRDELTIWDVTFPHPLVQAAVYEHVGPASRVRLHRAAAELVDDGGAALRHRVAATRPPDDELAEVLTTFARRESTRGAWASAAAALVEASRLSSGREQREQRLLRAIDAVVSAGDLVQGSALARDAAQFEPGPPRDAALGYLAVLRGRALDAESLLLAGWDKCDSTTDPHLAALIALRLALHSLGRLRGPDVVDWSDRSMALVPEDEAVRLEAVALRGMGLGLTGRVEDALEGYASVLARRTGHNGLAERTRMARGWLQVVNDEFDGVPRTLAETARSQLQGGSVRIAVWCYVWLSRANYLMGEWDEAALAADCAVSLLEETGHEWLRPVARWAAVSVPANRGDWSTAEDHVRHAAADSADYELMIVAGALAKAGLASAVGDYDTVLNALEPVRAIEPRQGIDEPGYWPWQHLYAEALVGAKRLEEAAKFLGPHEELAAARARRSCVARLARVRGQLEAAAGRMDLAELAFRHGLDQLTGLSLPFERAQLELAYAQLLRRRGHRRAAASQLEAARNRFAALGARPYVERCDVEMTGSGLGRPTKREFDPVRLTPREFAVARRAAAGVSNRDIAAEMLISVKTVQFHVGNIYAKLGVRSRVQLAARLPAIQGTTDLRD
jgi:DNA-binding CsgD family transcriptional regulator